MAEAIVSYAAEKGLNLTASEAFQAIPGKGIEAKINGKNVTVGTRSLMKQRSVNYQTVEEEVQRFEADGKTAMLIAIDYDLKGVIAVADTIKDTTIEAIEQLQSQDLEVIMLTGDNERTAEAIAKQVGISQVIAKVLPKQKAEKVKMVQQQGKQVPMVGDGIN